VHVHLDEQEQPPTRAPRGLQMGVDALPTTARPRASERKLRAVDAAVAPRGASAPPRPQGAATGGARVDRR